MRLQRLYRELEEAILKRNLLVFWKKQEKVNYAMEIKALSALNISKLGMFSIRYWSSLSKANDVINFEAYLLLKKFLNFQREEAVRLKLSLLFVPFLVMYAN